MRKIFIHPDVKINGAAVSKQILPAANKVLGVIPGLDSNALNIGQQLATGNISGGIEGLAGSFTDDPTLKATIGVVADIVQTVLMKGADGVNDADGKVYSEQKKSVEDTNTTTKKLSDQGEAQSNDIVAKAQEGVEEGKSSIEDAAQTINNTAEETRETLETNRAIIEDNAQVIQRNEEEIQQKEQRREELMSQINQRMMENGIPVENPAEQNNRRGNVDNGAQQGEGNEESVGISLMPKTGDSDIDNLIEEYNTLGTDIGTLRELNRTLSTQASESSKETEEIRDNAISVSDEQAAYIDEQSNNIMSLCTNAQSAIKEISSLLQGQFPKLNQVTAIKLAGTIAKSSICGTESGILAAAATAMGVGSIFSFGATAQKTAELTKGATNKGLKASEGIAQAAVEKGMELAMKKIQQVAVNKLMAAMNIPSEMQSTFTSYFNDIMSSLPKDFLTQASEDSGTTKGNDNSSSNQGSATERQKPEQNRSTA